MNNKPASDETLYQFAPAKAYSKVVHTQQNSSADILQYNAPVSFVLQADGKPINAPPQNPNVDTLESVMRSAHKRDHLNPVLFPVATPATYAG